MKKLFFNRHHVLQAIHAATPVLFLMAASRGAMAQVTSPFQVSGSTITTTGGTFGNGSGVNETSTTYSSITVGAGTTVNQTTPFGGGGSSLTDYTFIVGTASSSFTNAGTLSLSSNSSFYQAPVFLNQNATALTVSNTGTISSSDSDANVSAALSIISGSGDITVTNSGLLTASLGNQPEGLRISSSSGNVSITNSASGTMSGLAGVFGGNAVDATTSGAGTMTFVNAGTLTGGGSGGELTTDTGSITATNSGYVGARDEGYDLSSRTGGSITFSNTGTVTTSSLGGTSVFADTVGSISVTNSGLINYNDLGLELFGGATTVNNTGPITSTNSGAYAAIYVEQNASGNVEITNSGAISNTHNGIVVYQDPGTVVTSVVNTGPITVSNNGIFLFTPGSVTDSGDISAAADAITVPSGSHVTIKGLPTIGGTISGGASSGSTSTLSFNLTIPAAQLAAAKAQLNADIAAYATQNGGDLTFVVDGMDYDISDFAFGAGDITDNLGTSRLYARTPGFYSLGYTIDHFNTGSAQAAAILAALGNIPSSGLTGALSELSPKSLEVFRNVAFDNNTFNDTTINNHLANLRDGLTGFDSSSLSVNAPGIDPSLTQIQSHLLAYTPSLRPGLISDVADPVLGGVDTKSVQVSTTPSERWSSFIAGKVILADLSNNLNLQDSDYTTGDVTAGVDYRLDDHWTVGALVAYAHSDIGLDDRNSSATVDSYTPGIYASYVDGGWYGNAMAAYTRNAYTSDRMIDIPGIAGDNHGATSGNQGTGNLTGGYEFQRGAFKFGPVATLEYVHLDIQSMQEDGPTSLDINNQSQDSLRSLIGFEGRFAARVGSVELVPHLSVSWMHEYLDNSDGITSQFTSAGGGSFSVETDSPDRDSAFIDAGLDATINQSVTVFVDYSTQVGQDDFYAQSAQAGVRIGF